MSTVSGNSPYSQASVKPSKNGDAKNVAKNVIVEKKLETIEQNQKINSEKKDAKVELSDKARELQEELNAVKKESMAQKAQKIHEKKFGNISKPGIFFISGFDWFGAGSIKGNYDGIKDMSEAIDGAKHYSWDQKDEIIEDIKSRKPDQPIVLVGHSFGGDTAMEVAQELNTIENGFRKIDLLISLDAVGANNDKVPQNVGKNINYLASGPWNFLNDGPNIAIDYTRTKVENFLRKEAHADLDDTTDIQVRILEEVNKAIS